ncbi:hypothetical protein [Limnoglobus roseus]|uniref:Uncharacterized protein n=1 Tax=Limnoglobus roseus TaxID=2598579 RepID=A0A5C1A9L9_9BACT|nr:hypothetical protein [Limnoglobus roseus]QEL14502.1 hypothetical protein PX52LOC_01392 [Limnoglobus roseus]
MIGLASVIALAGLGAGAYFLFGGKKSSTDTAPVAGGQALIGQAPPTDAGINWVPAEDTDFAFKAAFPNLAATPYNPLDEIADPKKRDFAASVMKSMKAKYLQTRDGNRRYIINAVPLELGGMPPKVYLERLGSGLSLMYEGFTPEPGPVGESAGHPCQDFLLKADGKAKALRVVVTTGLNYTLVVEGSDVSLADPIVKGFFEHFASTKAAPASMTPKSTEPAPTTKPKTPTATAVGEWKPFSGSTVKFDMLFPGDTPTTVGTFDRVTNSTQRNYMETTWSKEQVTYESFEANQGGLKFTITAFFDGKLKHISASNAQGKRITMLQGAIYDKAVRHVFRTNHGNDFHDEVYSLTMKSGTGKVIVREVRAGSYSYFLRIEGTTSLNDEDPTVWKFMNSLKWPADAIEKK